MPEGNPVANARERVCDGDLSGGTALLYAARRGEDRERQQSDLRGQFYDGKSSGRQAERGAFRRNGIGRAGMQESTRVIELLEELLEAGFPEKAAIR